jgi:hypothetical protein
LREATLALQRERATKLGPRKRRKTLTPYATALAHQSAVVKMPAYSHAIETSHIAALAHPFIVTKRPASHTATETTLATHSAALVPQLERTKKPADPPESAGAKSSLHHAKKTSIDALRKPRRHAPLCPQHIRPQPPFPPVPASNFLRWKHRPRRASSTSSTSRPRLLSVAQSVVSARLARHMCRQPAVAERNSTFDEDED